MQEITLIDGDMKAKTGKEGDGDIVYKFGIRNRNERRERWVKCSTVKDQTVTKNWLQKHPRHIRAWRILGGETKDQIGYIKINDSGKHF